MLEVVQLAVLLDNYIYIIHNSLTKETAVVDPAVSQDVLVELSKKNWTLDYILNTHHHFDHVGGNKALKKETNCTVIGYAGDKSRIPCIDRDVENNEILNILGSEVKVIFVPGHTKGHVVYFFIKEKYLFCGDTLFSMGCGRLFEGSVEEMHNSLKIISNLPEETKVYCAHEYTMNNAKFAMTVDFDNAKLHDRYKEVESLRKNLKPTIPSYIGQENDTNPFLRTGDMSLRKNINMLKETDVEVFAYLRQQKDIF